jgi:hypothetical protein
MDISRLPSNHNIEAQKQEFDIELDFDLEEDIDIENKDENSEADDAKRKNQQAINRKGRNSSQSDHKSDPSIVTSKALFNDEISVNDLYKRSADKLLKTRSLESLHKKIELDFQMQLKQSLQEKFYFSTAQLIPDKLLHSKEKDKETEIDKSELNEALVVDKEESSFSRRLRQTQTQEKNILKKTQEKQSVQQNDMMHMDKHTIIKEYVLAYSTNLVKKDIKKEEEAKQLKQEMLKKGVSTKQLVQIEKAAQQLVTKDLKKMLKKNFMDVALSFTGKMTPELFSNYAKYNSMLEVAKEAKFFDANPKGLDLIREESKAEVRNFLSNELDRSLVETKLRSDDPKDLVKMFSSFNGLAKFSGFNANTLMKGMAQKLNDEGLVKYISPDVLGPIESDSQSNYMGGQSKQQPQQAYEGAMEDEETKLLNLYIQSNMTNKFVDRFLLKFSVMKQEARLKDWVNFEELQKKAFGIALLRLRMELRHLFELRATLAALKGAEYDAFQKRLKQVLKSLSKLGRPVSAKELRELRDQSNRSMFYLLKEDYIKLEVFLASQPGNIVLLRNKHDLLATLDRLKRESQINESIKPKLMEDLHFLSDVNIVEAA